MRYAADLQESAEYSWVCNNVSAEGVCGCPTALPSKSDGDNVLFPQASFIAAGDGDSHMMFIQTVREIATCGWCPACLSEFADRADQRMPPIRARRFAS